MPRHEWQTCGDPEWMLWKLDPIESGRKSRLLAASFCRRVARLMTEGRTRRLLAEADRLSVFGSQPVPYRASCLVEAVDEVERVADGHASCDTLAPVAELTDRLSSRTISYYYACYDESWGPFDHDLMATCEATAAVYEASRPRVDPVHAADRAARAVHRAGGGDEQHRTDPSEQAAQCDLIRCLFRTPGRNESPADPSWLTPTVVAVAAGAYDGRAFDRLQILADALQDAGCEDADVLAHCRGSGPHVRGCWVLDLVLGKV